MAKRYPSLRPRTTLGIFVALLLLSVCRSTPSLAQAARFDLEGPKVEVRVTRDGKTLPIANVPNLQPGDKLWLHPDLPATQSVNYLLIAAFLRGNTNPPPDEWFFKIETWNKKVKEEGSYVTVPAEAQQAILFLAPETGGDFNTLRKAVRGRPGIFVRASQDLSEAGFEQARIEKYIASMRKVPPSDQKALMDHSVLLSRTLSLKPNDDCFKRPVDLQYNCLIQSGNQALLDDSHAQNVIASLSNGPSSDFITAASYTGMAGGGTYSAYVGAVVDLFRILGGLHSAQYQYIPAISFPEGASLNLRLNTPPSFRNPKSVIVIGLPSVQKAVPPPLRATDPKFVSCLLKPDLVLPVDGAPLVFSTSFAHDLVLHINTENGKAGPKDIPLTPDAFQGGLIVTPSPDRKLLPMPSEAELTDPKSPPASSTPASNLPPAAPMTGTVTGTVSGLWGFDAFTGPTLDLQAAPGGDWHLATDDPLIAGRENHVLLASNGNACVDAIRIELTPGSYTPVTWKSADRPNLLDLRLPLKSPDPGNLNIAVQQFGNPSPYVVSAKIFTEPATLTALQFYAGDTSATATGTNLSQVKALTLAGLTFTPAPASDAPTPSGTPETLPLTLPDKAAAPKLRAGDKLTASVALKDGRTLVLPVTVGAARPSVTLLSRNMGRPTDPILHLVSEEDLPTTQQLTFSLKSSSPFPRTGKIEVASVDDSLHADLTVASGNLVLQNPHTIVGTLDPLKTFGTSAFGPLHLRAVTPEGVASAWLPIATLVRLPGITNLQCPAEGTAPCTLNGADLYLLDSISTDAAFTSPTAVPDGFVGSTVSIPRPTSLPSALSASRPSTVTLYLHLRDDPDPANTAIIPVLALPAATTSDSQATNKSSKHKPISISKWDGSN
ncbi:hypothetical protein [Granulicella sp. dw_53]|uniref:hypothetical protein n=1 Tax=Granulicella sp. dw_53 TaxID=2719792 RepID=UPI001BD42420|nr:hypothetical protein [Granulicella sp. dw_53]